VERRMGKRPENGGLEVSGHPPALLHRLRPEAKSRRPVQPEHQLRADCRYVTVFTFHATDRECSEVLSLQSNELV